VDPLHFEWMHMNWSVRLKDKGGPYSPRHLKLAFEEFDYGIVYRRIREGMSEEDPMWKVGRVCLWPNALFTGDHFEWRVPIDDENTLSVTWCFSRVPKGREPYVQEQIPAWRGPVRDADTGRLISSHVMNQDFVAWVGQGVIPDRTHEHLGTSDTGIIMMRQRFLKDIEAIARGEDPKATVRDPELNRCLTLPIAERKNLVEGLTLEELAKHPLGSGQLNDYVFRPASPQRFARHTRKPWASPSECDLIVAKKKITRDRKPGYLRIATEEAFAPPELLARWKAIIERGGNLDPGFVDQWGYFLGQSPRALGIASRLQDIGEQRIRDMDSTGIARQILSLTNPGVQIFDAATGAALAISCNDQLAEAIGKHPDRSPALQRSRRRIPRLRRRNSTAECGNWG